MADSAESPLNSAVAPAPIWRPAINEAAWAVIAAATLLTIVYALAFAQIHPEFVRFMGQAAKPLTASGKNFIPVSVGKGRKEGSQYIIEDLNGDEAILALPWAFQAEDFPFIKVELEGLTRYTELKILWRRADAPSQTHALEFNRSGDGAAQIAMVYGNENYRGQIKDIALLFFDGAAKSVGNNNNTDIRIRHIEFRPFSIRSFFTQVYDDWVHGEEWGPSSNNKVRGSHANATLPPNLAINLVYLCSLTLAYIWCAFRTISGRPNTVERLFSITCSVLCLVWVLSETLRWPARIDQATDSIERYSGKALKERIRSSSDRCSQYPEDCNISLYPYF